MSPYVFASLAAIVSIAFSLVLFLLADHRIVDLEERAEEQEEEALLIHTDIAEVGESNVELLSEMSGRIDLLEAKNKNGGKELIKRALEVRPRGGSQVTSLSERTIAPMDDAPRPKIRSAKEMTFHLAKPKKRQTRKSK